MSLKVHREPDDFRNEPPENCCLCGQPTRFWHITDVALCKQCAKTASRDELPTKHEWFNASRGEGDAE